MTLKESLGLYCLEYDQCSHCPIWTACERFHEANDPYEMISDMDDDRIKVIAYNARKIAEKILFHLDSCDENSNPVQS